MSDDKAATKSCVYAGMVVPSNMRGVEDGGETWCIGCGGELVGGNRAWRHADEPRAIPMDDFDWLACKACGSKRPALVDDLCGPCNDKRGDNSPVVGDQPLVRNQVGESSRTFPMSREVALAVTASISSAVRAVDAYDQLVGIVADYLNPDTTDPNDKDYVLARSIVSALAQYPHLVREALFPQEQ